MQHAATARMKMIAATLALGACSIYGGTPSGTPDAGYTPPSCHYFTYDQMQCAGGAPEGASYVVEDGGSAHCFGGQTQVSHATCAQGCIVETVVTGALHTLPIDQPGLLCAERPSAQVGDACSEVCWPTRAELAADGTVTGQNYLACDPTTDTCVAAPAPVIPGYLGPSCDPNYTSQVTSGVGYIAGTQYEEVYSYPPCLIVWSGGVQYTGGTVACLGDWDCPAGSLCDDQLDLLQGDQPFAVCKPGPKGVLTAAMLSH